MKFLVIWNGDTLLNISLDMKLWMQHGIGKLHNIGYEQTKIVIA